MSLPLNRQIALHRPSGRLVSCYAYCGGYRWHWRQSNDSFPGQPVVLIHGLVVTSLTLLPLAETIAGWAPVLLPDLPGFGHTEGPPGPVSIPDLAAAVAEWMQVAGASPAHIVGNSFGSQVAAELAMRFPHRVRSLTLVGPTIDPTARDFRTQASRLLADLPQEPLSLWTEPFGIRSAFRTLRNLLLDRIETKLPLIKAPSLILRGMSDPIAPESWIEHAASLLADARAHSLSSGAHCVHFSHPGLVASAVRQFTFPFRMG